MIGVGSPKSYAHWVNKWGDKTRLHSVGGGMGIDPLMTIGILLYTLYGTYQLKSDAMKEYGQWPKVVLSLPTPELPPPNDIHRYRDSYLKMSH